jgi:hypothetical protein
MFAAGLTGAELASISNEAAIRAARRGSTEVYIYLSSIHKHVHLRTRVTHSVSATHLSVYHCRVHAHHTSGSLIYISTDLALCCCCIMYIRVHVYRFHG